MQRTTKAFVYGSETHYVAECLTIGVVTQRKTLDQTTVNLQDAVALYLEEEEPEEVGIASR